LSTTARAVAFEALRRIDDGAFANLVLPGLLGRSGLSERDRAFVTELVYGATRMRRACDWMAERFLFRDVDDDVRAALRLGVYQLAYLDTPAHAAVGETVDLVSGGARGLVNAVLRKVAAAGPVGEWPSPAVALSFPDWIVDRLTADLGHDRAIAALAQMNEAATATERPDGYIQDVASQLVAAAVAVGLGDRVLDACAAPGGKATALAAAGAAIVVAADIRPSRISQLAANATRLGATNLSPCAADARRLPFRSESFDRVLVDAPCSGLGVLRRRADARWRIGPDDVDVLAELQRQLLAAAAPSVRPGGLLVYSVCTLTSAETVDIDRWLDSEYPGLTAVDPPDGPWEQVGRGVRLLPQTIGSDGMYLLRLRQTARPPG
jgi:16S rRNA (cytosine967-C5)-methyltransferase